MPLYDYECKECHLQFEKQVPVAERDTVRCPECDSEAEILITVIPPKHVSWSKWNIGE